ncbi:MAG TPA: hypothetical protein VFC19_02815 [Candidatus Limnocylindrales bacterium]|nr:hypothetical protein [Candidatus Limnocylindrales bacterium]
MRITATPVGSLPLGNYQDLRSLFHPMVVVGGVPHFAVRSADSLRILAADFGGGRLFEAAAFPAPWERWRWAPDAVAPDLSFAVFSGETAIRAVGRDGRTRWEHQHDCWGCGDLESGSVIVSADGARVWASAPSPHAEIDARVPYEGDDWLVLDAASGHVVGLARLECAAAGSFHLLHPDGVHVGLSVGEGQDGSSSYWGRLDGDLIDFRRIGGENDLRVLAAVSPSGKTYVTVAHEQYELSVHGFDDDTVLGSYEVDDNGDDFLSYEAGYVTEDRILAGEDEGDRHWLIEAPTGQLLGEMGYPAPATGTARPLGNGTWLTSGGDAIRRWRL